jgi:hypothetical protein
VVVYIYTQMIQNYDYEYEHEHECGWNLMVHCVTQQSPLERGVYLTAPNNPPPVSMYESFTPETPTNEFAKPNRPTIVIWHSPSCNACINSEPLFVALEANTDGFSVQRRMATPDVIRTMIDADGHPHIVTIPLYDIIWPEMGSDSVYGKNMKLVSVRNNDVRELTRYVPSLKIVTNTSQ